MAFDIDHIYQSVWDKHIRMTSALILDVYGACHCSLTLKPEAKQASGDDSSSLKDALTRAIFQCDYCVQNTYARIYQIVN